MPSSTGALPAQRNPARLAVAQRSSGSSSPPPGSDVDTLRRAELRRAQLARRVERWTDRLMEEPVDRATFKRIYGSRVAAVRGGRGGVAGGEGGRGKLLGLEEKTDQAQPDKQARQATSPTRPGSALKDSQSGNSASVNPVADTPINPVSALLARLTIHERPTPAEPPVPPSFQPAPLSTSPTASPVRQALPAPLSPHATDRRTSSSLISTPSALARTIVSATKRVGPVHVDDDSASEDEAEPWRPPPEDDETRALFDQARIAREMME
ncbi:hypothetical protein IAU60_001928 [Kwoniella sp. DSM 27419]